MKKFLCSLLIVLICLTSLASCTSATKTPEINRQLMPMSIEGGITYGLYGMDGEIEKNYHFQIDSAKVFETILSFGSLIEVEREYKILLFINYIQIAFSVNGKKANTFFDFTTEPYEHTQFTLTLPQLDDGFYDLLFVIVKDPNNDSLDEDYRKQTDLSHLITMRYSLQIGTSTTANEEPVLSTYDTIENEILDGVFLNQDRDELNRLLTLECELFEEPELFIHIGNQSDNLKTYVVILLCDWQQLPIESQDILCFSISPKSRITLPIRIDTLMESGVHNLTAICTEEPFQEATIQSRRADFSIRVGINVNN